jgi:hypothetical protein
VSQPARISDLARAQAPAGHDAPDYLDGLNPEQREAVLAVEGPVLVLAGAGTGKTRVLTTRLAHILSLGLARPWELLAVTFTNKAAREMRERIGHLIGPAAEGLRWVGTFHSVAAQILRRHAELVGLKSSFTILDTDDQERVLKQLIEAEGLDPKRWTAKSLANLIDGWKNRGWLPADLPTAEHAYHGGKAQALYAAYQARLRGLNACDFGDSCCTTSPSSANTRTCLRNTTTASATCWWTSTRTPTSPSTSGCACSPRSTATSAASATTTSRSTAGAARRWTTSSASSATSPAPRSCASSATTAPPATSSPPPPA